MKLYSGKVKPIADEMTRTLMKEEAIEVEPDKVIEVQLDIESVLHEYIRTDRRIGDEARELLDKRHLDYSGFGKVKREVAKRYNFGLGENGVGWIIDQLIELLLHTAHVEEVWVEDHDLRRLIKPILLKQATVDEELDQEVRNKIKNLTEGSTAWDIKYEQVKAEMRRRKGLD